MFLRPIFLLFVFVSPLVMCETDKLSVNTAHALIEAMHARYENKVLKTLSLEQKSTTFAMDGTVKSVDVWHEALQLPDKLLIKIGDRSLGNGLLFNNGSMYQFSGGTLINTKKTYHLPLLLGFSVYAQPPDKTLSALTELGFDLSRFHEKVIEGKAVYIVGTDDSNDTLPQFWIEKDRLLLVRHKQWDEKNRLQDLQFVQYQAVGEGWLVQEALVYSDKKLILRAEYELKESIRFNQAIFNPVTFKQASW